MPLIRLPSPSRRLVPRLMVALVWSSASLSAADTALSDLVRKFTEKHAAPTADRPASPPVATATKPAADAKKSAPRKPSPPLGSLPAPKAGGPRRILLVDDDWNGNTASGAARPSGSDTIFRDLVAAAVGGNAAAWSHEMVETSKSGPSFERLRNFNVVVWYTGESYGGGADSVATLSTEDERTVRRYLQEVGGAFVLVSPGFLSTRSYGTTWTESDHAFLREVMGVNGFVSLAQRFAAGTVRATNGTRFEVEAKGVIETQFSAVNPDGAAVVFSTTLDAQQAAVGAVPVAVAHPYGGGRFVYVGFSFENIARAGRANAFGLLLDAATGPRPAVAAGEPSVTPTVVQRKVGNQRIVEAPPPVSPPPPEPAPTQETAPEETGTQTTLTYTGIPYFRKAKVKIYTGNDNKEAPSKVRVELLINTVGMARPENYPLNAEGLRTLTACALPELELRINSVNEYAIEPTRGSRQVQFEYIKGNAWGEQDAVSLALCQQYGLRLDILYEPNFVLDAWRIERVDLEIDFGYWEWWRRGNNRIFVQKTAASFPRSISFHRSALLNDSNRKLTLVTDGFFFPQ